MDPLSTIAVYDSTMRQANGQTYPNQHLMDMANRPSASNQPVPIQPTAITVHPVDKTDPKQLALEIGAVAGVGLFLWWMLRREK